MILLQLATSGGGAPHREQPNTLTGAALPVKRTDNPQRTPEAPGGLVQLPTSQSGCTQHCLNRS